MKRLFIIIALFVTSINFVIATPYITQFSISAPFLYNGKIKMPGVSNTSFIANISAARQMSGGTYESVEMEVVFYLDNGTLSNELILKTITLNSGHFNGTFLQYYNESNLPNNQVEVVIPAGVTSGMVKIKYRSKDSNNNWLAYSNLNNYGYNVVLFSIHEGKLIRLPDGKVYSVMSGQARHIQTASTLAGVYISSNNITDMGAIPTELSLGDPIQPNTHLLRNTIDERLYFAEGNYIRHIVSVEVANIYKFRINNNSVIGITNGLSGYTIGPPID